MRLSLRGFLDANRFRVDSQRSTPKNYFMDLAVFYLADNGHEHLVMIVEVKNELAECLFQSMRFYQVPVGARLGRGGRPRG